MSNLIREWFYKNRKLIVEETDINLTYRFLNLIKEQTAGKRALIIGDSQGGSNATGGALASILSNAGYNVVNKSKYGSYTAQAADQIPDTNFDLVILFTGGHIKSNPGDALKIAKMFPNTTKFIISGPPPVQRIKDISGSVKKFPYLRSVPKEYLETYFVNPRDQRAKSMYQGRERRNSAFKQAAANAGIGYIDPRAVFGVTNPADFPVISNSDGIHMYGDIASQMATAIAGTIDQQLKADPARVEKTPKATKVIQAAKEKAPRCLRSNILAFGAGMGKYRDMKNRVIALQQTIVDKKLTKDPENFVDGKFGEKTLMAVIGSQILNDLKPDGCAGPETLAALGVKEAPSVEKAIATTTAGMEEKEFAKKQTKVPTLKSGVEIRGLTSEQKQVADMIFRKYSEAGLSPNIAAAAVVNGVKESNLKYYLVGDGGNSVGLFQLHRGSKRRPFWQSAGLDPDVAAETRKQFRERCVRQGLPPGGYKCSVSRATGMKKFAKERENAGDWRFNPEKNTEAIIDIEVKRGAGRKLRAADKAGASIPELAAIFSRDIERPADKEGNMQKRREKAIAMFGDVRLDDKVMV